jgi:SAM-dependent methyltransferase
MQTHNASGWTNIFEKRWEENEKYILDKYANEVHMFKLLSSLVGEDGTFTEVGCGSGVNSIVMSKLGKYNVNATDYLESNINLIENKCNELSINVKNIKFSQHDIIKDKIENCTVVFSDGVLEHFIEHEIIQSIKNMRNAKYITFGVPVNNADVDYGDENIYPSSHWNSLIYKALGNECLEVKVFPIGHKNKFFLLLRKIIPFYKESSKYSSLMNRINNFLFSFEVKVSSFNLYVVENKK